MKHEIKKNLYDVNVSINSIFDYLGDELDFTEYLNNKLLRRAIEREIEIIGEAINRALKQDPDLQIENAKRIVDTRNWVIHGYDKVDDVIIWGLW
ncbi:HepT-like ribonuclease domain-containing protein [Cyclobacterium sp. SYSU L10401]|uniref:HepT-like ribonuclease domain-containing protein n=1 Tax=Cyclobacterium sp. SYSU L10401 TaxID=2678657 RepID=UPI00196A0B7C|nr:HepT-like ribonuclease domain-containing protein [Cyclobacterium sp. SYSU L10401]